jgi:DNA-binding NtrC family response regulator
MFTQRARHVGAAIAVAGRPADRGFRVVRMPGDVAPVGRDQLLREIRRGVDPLGFVMVDVHAAEARLPDRRLCGRHVVLVADAARAPEGTAGWVRLLGAASSRAHMLVLLDRPAVTAPVAVRERAPSYEVERGGVLPAGRSLSLARAVTSARRRRYAAAERWLRAALEDAVRRGDDRGAAAVGGELIALAVSRGRWPAAWRQARSLLSRLSGWESRLAVGRRATAVALDNVLFDEAESMTAAIAAEAAALDRPLPAWPRLRLAEIRIWQGRLEESTAALDHLDPRDEHVRFWRALLAWLTRDAGRWAWPVLPSTSAHGEMRLWDAVSTVLLAPVQPGGASPRRIEGCVASMLAADRAAFGRRFALATSAASGALRALGHHTAASVLAARRERDRGAPLACRHVTPAGGAASIATLSRGDRTMHLIHAVPAVLQRVSDAEDAPAALQAACDWARDQPGVRGAAVVTSAGLWAARQGVSRHDVGPDDLRDVCASTGPRVTCGDGRASAAAPVRYAGAVIGVVIVIGGVEIAETLREMAQTLAPLVGPALRTLLDARAAAADRQGAIPEILGFSPGITAVREAVIRAAGTSFPVLIEGESGTGKELVARAVHRLSPRRDRAFCPVNCAALTDDLIEAELFGHARGAFTGAVGQRAGLFEEADAGTLFMDEVSELSPRAQAKVLRAVQEGEIRRLGENASRRVRVRVVAATNRPLAEAASRGAFREDLLFRLAVARVRIPPLRDRVEDVPVLARTFWTRTAPETGTRAVLGPDAVAALCRHRWPGNVRELQNVVAALVLSAPMRGRVGARLVAQSLASSLGAAAAAPAAALSLDAARRQCERQCIADALARHGGRRSDTARELGLTRQGLAKALRRVGLTMRRPDRDRRTTGVA